MLPRGTVLNAAYFPPVLPVTWKSSGKATITTAASTGMGRVVPSCYSS